MVANDILPAEGEYAALLLGAPQLRCGGERLALRRRQVRALIYYLAHDEALAPRDRLAYLFWPDRPERTARRNLTRLLSAARAELGDRDLLISRQGALALDRERVWSDCVAFDRLTEAAEREALEQAEALVRGRFLEGFALPDSPAYGRWQDDVARQYERRYLDLLLRLVDVCEEAGDAAAAIDYARRYLAIDELAEEVHQRLIGLYAAAGDRAAAARQFEACTLILERELGVRPLPETRAAYEAAMAEGQAPASVAPTWSVLPSLDLPLVGRGQAWQRLRRAHRRLRAGGLILIAGEPGIGKSRLMQDFATSLDASSEALVLAGTHPPGAQRTAYTAITQALRQALGRRERWQGIRPVWLAEAGRLLPEMGAVFPNLPAPVEVERSQAQARLFEALNRCLLGLAAHGPLLLCLDDVHWADAETMGWLTGLAPRLNGSDVCIVATYRSAHAAALANVKRAYARPGLLAELSLSRLTLDAVERILAQLPEPPDPGPLAARIHHATGGNPFFVLETVRALLEAERLAEPPSELPLAPTVEAAIGRRLDNLSPLGRQVLESAAVLGSDLSFGLLEETAGRSEMEVAEGLDEVVGRQLLVNGEARRFSHDLVRQVTYGEISPWRRRILHRRAAGALETARDDEGKRAWATIAGHYDAAGDGAEAIRCYERAAAAAAAIYAHEEAVAHLRRAIELANEETDEAGSAAVLAGLYEALGDNLVHTGAFAEAEEVYRAALRRLPDGGRLHWAAVESKLARTMSPQQRPDDAEAVYRRALARLDGEPPPAEAEAWRSMRLNVLLGLVNALYWQFRPEAMVAIREQTQELLDAVGTAEQHAQFYSRLNQMAFLQNGCQSPPENVPLARKALARAQESGRESLIARQQFHLGFHLLWHGDLDEAEGMLRKALEGAEALGNSWLQTQSLVYSTIVHRLQGDHVQVAAYLPHLVEISQRIGHSMYTGVGAAQAAWLHYRAGEWQEARARAAAALEEWDGSDYPLQWLAHWPLLAVALKTDGLPDAVDAARSMLDTGQQKLPDVVEEALQTAVAAWEDGDHEKAREAFGRAIAAARERGYL